MNGGGVFGALIYVIGILIVFAILFGFFLVVPFFVFLGGMIAMFVSDRRRDKEAGNGNGNGSVRSKPVEAVEVVETTEVVREVKS
ncbi:MAG: hypothetical protein KDB66_04280 [Solirubrobacterales bacterium]|nr:hypothetical protein [Solirubrobacterales bacterium]MCB8916151.1 hypothetical protein [Thermoleophilales bacterium]